MSQGRRRLGAEGEACAARHLQRRGYRVLARNVRAGGVEMDLVVAKGRTIAFVEVKTRASQRAGAPEDAVHAAKRRRLVRGAVAWLHENRVRGWRIRFDVVAVVADDSGALRVRHRPAAFDAGD